MAVSAKKNGEFITGSDVSEMKYTNKVVEETLRLANISPFLFCSGDEEVEFQGYIIPKGWKLLLWLRYNHSNSEYFMDPLCYNPDRWNKPAKPGTFQVFGGGSRSCVGNMLSRTELAIFLHHLVVGYKWELINPDAKIDYLPHPKPIDRHQAICCFLERERNGEIDKGKYGLRLSPPSWAGSPILTSGIRASLVAFRNKNSVLFETAQKSSCSKSGFEHTRSKGSRRGVQKYKADTQRRPDAPSHAPRSWRVNSSLATRHHAPLRQPARGPSPSHAPHARTKEEDEWGMARVRHAQAMQAHVSSDVSSSAPRVIHMAAPSAPSSAARSLTRGSQVSTTSARLCHVICHVSVKGGIQCYAAMVQPHEEGSSALRRRYSRRSEAYKMFWLDRSHLESVFDDPIVVSDYLEYSGHIRTILTRLDNQIQIEIDHRRPEEIRLDQMADRGRSGLVRGDQRIADMIISKVWKVLSKRHCLRRLDLVQSKEKTIHRRIDDLATSTGSGKYCGCWSYCIRVGTNVPWQQMIELMQISQASLTQGDQKPWVQALCTELHSGNLYKAVEVVLAEGLTVKHQYGRTSETEPNIRDCSTDNGRMRSLGSCSEVQKAKAGCSEISSEQGKLRMLMCQTLKFSSCSSVHHARSCTRLNEEMKILLKFGRDKISSSVCSLSPHMG
ncbi:hypothetical protein HYC85_029796 [Camellia sinensis]|uniref:Uncharacterized protein n=1 Tax=Camellia sinensis TaxID=4442 RepID=A0A7J7FZQ6_CAMSI|nr:hypothetical protein HYC85_029796 [Camellia sinensis]